MKKLLLSSLMIFLFLGSLMDCRRGFSDEDPSLAELKRQIDLLGQEVQKLKTGEASGGGFNEPTANTMDYGFGPGASKVYRTQSGLSIGGYGEILWEHFNNGFDAPGKRVAPGEDFGVADGQSRVDVARAVLYVGYKFSDDWVFNSEIEFEKGGQEVSVEFLYFDYFCKKYLNFRVGNLLLPVGLTNETHEPTTYLGTHRPLVETLIIPTTWSAFGFGFFGDLKPITYRTYLVTGLNASAFTANNGVQGGNTESGFANGTALAWVGRVDYTAAPGLLPGGSIYIGDSSTSPVSGFDLVSVPMKMAELHVQYNYRALDLRALGAYTLLSNTDALNARLNLNGNNAIGSTQAGFYLQAGYDFLNGTPQALIPFVRFETVDTQVSVAPGDQTSGQNLIHETVVGLNYKPISQLVFKADYQWNLTANQNGVNQWNLAMGYVF